MNLKKIVKTIISSSVALVLCLPIFAASNTPYGYEKLKTDTTKKIETIDYKLEKLEKKISSLKGDMKDKMKDSYEEIIVLKDDLKQQLTEAKNATSSEWNSTKMKISKFTDDIDNRVDKAMR